MNSIDEEYDPRKNFLKLYLHIHNPLLQDKPYYKLDLSKDILYLHKQMGVTELESDGIFEFDKIFTNEKDNNLNIYNIVIEDIIKESLNGKSHCFISYGSTLSDKFKVFIGDTENKGILLQALDDIKNNDFNNNENIKTYLSYFCLCNDKFIDLSNNKGNLADKNLEENLMRNAIEINKNYDINNINKLIIEKNSNDVNDSIDKLFKDLMEIELKSKYHIYSKSHFCFVIYIINDIDNKIISTLTFILLNGSEFLSKNTVLKQNEVSSSLISVDSQYIYDSIIYSISCNKAINSDYKNYEKNKLSKITSILNNICFSPENDNIKFIIIGNILPITGQYETTKDTLMFLFNLKQNCFNNKKLNKNGEINIKRKSTQNRDDIIFDLESKMKFQADNIEQLNKIVQKKDEKIFDLEQNYKAQVEFMKRYFGFKGQIEVLLTGDVNTKEYKEAQNIREAKEDALALKRNIKLLEKNVKKKEEEIKKIKYEKEIRLNDQTMIEYYLLAENIKKNKEKDNENKREFFTQIEKLEKEMKNKDKIINDLKKEIEQKNKILISIPKVIKNKLKEKEKGKEKEKEKENSIDTEEKPIQQKDKKEIEKKELINMIKKNNEEYNKLKLKYENLLSQSQKKLEENINQMNKIINDNKLKYNCFKNELSELYNVFINIFNSFYKNRNKINLFEKTISNIENEINEFNFPNIFKLITKKNINKNFSFKNKKEETKKQEKLNEQITQEKIKETVLNFDDISKSITFPKIIDFIKSKNKFIFSFNKEQIFKLSKDALDKNYYEIITYVNKLEDYIFNYYESKEYKNNEKYEKPDIIGEYEEKIKKLKSSLNNELQKNYNSLIIINSQKKKIEEFNFKNLLKNSRYPRISTNEYCPTVSGTQYNKENNFLKSKNSSKIRNNTERNINIYQPTITSSSYKSNNLIGQSIESLDKYNKNKNINNKKRPLSSKIKNNGKNVTFLKINNNNFN